MLDLVRRGFFSQQFLVVDGSATVGELRMSLGSVTGRKYGWTGGG